MATYDGAVPETVTAKCDAKEYCGINYFNAVFK
jgi:hypothetical protein